MSREVANRLPANRSNRAAHLLMATARTMTLFVLASTWACAVRGKEPYRLRARMPVDTYLKSQMTATRRSISMQFPLLEVYDKRGRLVYHDDGGVRNSNLIAAWPAGLKPLRPISGTDPLSVFLDRVPGFKERKRDILGFGGTVIVSVEANDCPACEGQETAVEKFDNRKFKTGVLVLELSH